MPPKQTQQRVRLTNKTLEGRQFSSVRLPRTSEVPAQKINVDAMYEDLAHQPAATTSSFTDGGAATFDPIPSDSMFYIVSNSKYWPPPSLEELQQSTGIAVLGTDGFDAYDRRADDTSARQERAKVVKGELNHPRGKARKSTVTKLDDSSDDE